MSVESYGFKFVVDAKDAAKGYGDFQKAIDGVFASLTRFEQQAKKSLDAVTSSSKKGQSDIAKYAAQFKSLANIPVDGRAAPALLKLSDAMARFKAPNTTQITNMRNFFRILGSLPNLSATTSSISNIAKLSAAMNGFKAPSAAQAEKLILFSKALQQVAPGLASLGRVAGVSGVANELASVSIALSRLKIPTTSQATSLTQFARALQMMRIGGAGNMVGTLEALSRMNGFKAPTAAQTRNLQQFVNAINNLKVPENANQISAYLQNIAAAARNANASLQGFRGSLNSLNYGMKSTGWSGFTAGAHGARLEMMGLQNAFSGTFQAGSLLRSVLGSLTIGELGREFFAATQAANQFHASMEVLGQTPMMQSAEWERVRADANHFGADLMTFSDGFSKFAVAAHESGMKLSESFKVYEGFQTVMSAMHLATEQQQSVGLAIREIMDQGYVSTQRLTRQLGLVLPGALATLQKAWKTAGKENVNFFDALKKKMVDGQWALDTLANHYKTVYGPALAAALESPIQQFNILKNNVADLMVQIGNDGAKKAFADFIAKLSGGLDPKNMKSFAQAISDGLVKAIHRAGDAVDWFRANWDALRGPLSLVLSLMGKWMVLSAAFKIGSAIVGPLLAARTAFAGFNTTMTASLATGGRVRGMFTGLMEGIQPLPTGLGRLNVSAMAATTGMNALRISMNGLKAVGSGLLGLVGGPLGLAMLTLGSIVAGVTSHMLTAKIQVSEMTASVKESLAPLQGQALILSKTTTNSMNAAQGIRGVGIASSGASGLIEDVGNKALTAAGKFAKLADDARAAMLAVNQESITKLMSQNAEAGTLVSGNAKADYRSKLPSMLGGGGKGFNSVKDWFGSFSKMLTSDITKGYDNGETDNNLTTSIAKNNQAIKTLLLQRHDILVASNKDVVQVSKNGFEDAPDITDPLYKGSNAGGKKKKGPDPEKQLKAFENQMSEIMDKLMDGDPVGKLTSKFVQDLTKQGQILLNNKSYHDFLNGLSNDALHGKVSVDSLISALENGGIKGKALDDLKKRYGTDVNGIIKLLRKEQNEYEDAVKDATAKTLKEQYKGVDDALKKMSEHNPLLKLQLDFADGLETDAFDFLNSTAFADWMKHTKEDADGAATALHRLITALGDVHSRKDGLDKSLGARGLSVNGNIIPNLNTEGAQNEFKKLQETRKEDGQDIIDKMRQEYNLASLNNGQIDVANKLLEYYNKQMEEKGKVDLDQIGHMQQQIILWQKQIDLMKAQKDFYQNNGIKNYLSDIKTAGEFVHDFDNNALKGLEDTLYTLGTTGKLSFSSMIDSMQNSIIRFASQQLVQKFVSVLEPNAMTDKNPTMFGFLGKMLGGKGGNDYQVSNKTLIEESQITPMNVTIDPKSGQLLFGQGGGAAGTGTGAAGAELGSSIYPVGANGVDPLAPLGAGVKGDPTAIAGAKVAGSFQQNMASVIPMIGLMFAGSFKSPIAKIGAMFASMLLEKMMAGGSGGGSGGGLLGSLFGGGGSGGGGLLGSLFGGGGGGGAIPFVNLPAFPGAMEGGITGSLVNHYHVQPSVFSGAPHYSEGTPNTSGGHPAILHDNEAVIPLSRGRKVPVELTGMSSPANSGVTVNNHFNISSPDADSFRKSKSQIATDLHAAGARSWSRNN